MSIPAAAIEAAAEAIATYCGVAGSGSAFAEQGRTALEAAIPAIREALAQEVDHARELSGDRSEWVDGMYAAARIVRGGTL